MPSFIPKKPRTAIACLLFITSGALQAYTPPPPIAQPCPHIDIVGGYSCIGECVTGNNKSGKKVIQILDETDVITRFPGSNSHYSVRITSNGNYYETEIGSLNGHTLHTATANVVDRKYPVLEEYLFNISESCEVNGYNKVVRNPSPKNFKSCLIQCTKQPEIPN